MSDENDILREISKNLNQDGPRLKYANWLHLHASSDNSFAARAEFIFIQISIASHRDIVGGRPWTQELEAQLVARANLLSFVHRKKWEEEIRQTLGNSCKEILFSRGFPCDLRVKGINKLIASGILESETNTLTGLIVGDLGNQLPKLLSYSGIARLLKLDLGDNNLGNPGANAIANSPYLSKLSSLELWRTCIGDVGVADIASSANLNELTTFDLANNCITNVGVDAIARSPNFENLTMLDLSGNNVGDAGAISIASSQYLENLATLDLGSTNIGDAGAAGIASSKHLLQLTRLNLGNNNITAKGAAAIATSQHLSPSAKVSSLQSIGFIALADQVSRDAQGRYTGLH
jgi:uncharacterized protein (TIGR02996 family)